MAEHEEKTETSNREAMDADRQNNQRGEWNADQITDEASQKSGDEIEREIRRGDETKGDADNRDVAGGADSKDTPQGREEAKNDREGKANVNG